MTRHSARDCLACGSTKISRVLDLGNQEPANLYGEKGQHEVLSLILVACEKCGHGQQLEHYNPSSLFKEYLYASGTSQTLKNYFESLADVFARIFSNESRVLEIASNDGSFLDALRDRGFFPVRVDPSSVMSERARRKGHQVIEDFWPTAAIPDKKFDLVVAQNVLAHVPRPLEFLKSIGEVLAFDGIAFIQTSQSAMVENGEFDTIYHEHYSFFNERSMGEIVSRAGLTLQEFSYVSIHGGSMISLIRHSGSSPLKCREVERALTSDDFPFKTLPPKIKRPNFEDWEQFALIARNSIEATTNAIRALADGGQLVVAVGAAAKAVTFLRASEIIPNRIVDESGDKIGKEIPGVIESVENLDSVSFDPDGTIYFITAWNFYDELKVKISNRRNGKTHVFVRAFPEVYIEYNVDSGG